MTTLLARLGCVIKGHDWEWGLPSGHSWCHRCKRYDDHPDILRGDGVRAAWRKWSPVGIGLRRRDLSLRIGWYRFASLSVRLHFGFDRTSELPGLNVSLHVWRLRVWAGIGSGWQDEDGEGRSLGGLNVTFTTYELRWIGCWLGHKPAESERMSGYVYCDRCEQPFEMADAAPRKVAA